MSVMSIRIDEKRKKALKVIASLEGKGMGEIVSELIDDYVKKNKKKISANPELIGLMKLSENSFSDWGNEIDEICNDLWKMGYISGTLSFYKLIKNKKRPALIISPTDYNDKDNVIITFITSKLDLHPKLGDYKIGIIFGSV